FQLPEGEPQRLLLIVHHLAVDAVSWRLLAEDLERCYQALAAGGGVNLPAKTTSFQEWSKRQLELAASPQGEAELARWTAARTGASTSTELPTDFAAGLEANTASSSHTVSSHLTAEETSTLLRRLPRALDGSVEEALLAALAQSVGPWAGLESLLVESESHGRELPQTGDGGAEIDLGRTVGWMTAVYPLHLPVVAEPAAALEAAKQARIVASGAWGTLGYSLLRYLHPDEEIRRQMAEGPAAQLSFNYLGQLDREEAAEGLFRLTAADTGPARSPRTGRRHLLEVNASVREGQLGVHWTFSQTLHEQATVDGLAQSYLSALRSLLETAAAQPAAEVAQGYGLEDFSGLVVAEEALSSQIQGLEEGPVASPVEWISPLAPTQQGILFHSLESGEDGVYVGQTHCRLEGPLEVEAFEAAWQRVAQRHDALRTAFLWRDLDEPLQATVESVTVPLEQGDWSASSPSEQKTLLTELLESDRRLGFDLGAAPLMRLTLVREGADSHRLVWSTHHTILDGWSKSLLLQEVLVCYEALCQGREPQLPTAHAYRDYLAWRWSRREVRAEAFWRQLLAGYGGGSEIGDSSTSPREGEEEKGSASADHQLRLSAAVTQQLTASARQARLTLNTLAQGAWSLLLSRYSGDQDVVFGSVVAGRPQELPGADSMVGLFINTLPMRLNLADGHRVQPLLQALHAQQLEVLEYQDSSLVEVHGWSEVPRSQPLFRGILAFENFPVPEEGVQGVQGEGSGLRATEVQASFSTNYPFTLTVTPASELHLQLNYDGRRTDSTTARRMISHLALYLERLSRGVDTTLESLLAASPVERQQIVTEWNDTSGRLSFADDTNRTIHGLFQARAEKQPDVPALVAGDTEWTYAQLQERVNHLAGHLRHQGAGPEVTVGVVLERGPHLVVSLLAVLRAGAAYVPMDPSFPAERLAFMLEDSGIRLLLTETYLAESLPETSAIRLLVDELPETALSDVDLPEREQVDPDHLAYVIYTSGSTGRPKGVQISHGAVVNFLDSMASKPGLSAADTLVSVTTVSFDIAGLELFLPLTVGARVVLASGEEAADGEALAGLMEQHQATVLQATPATWRLLLEAGWQGSEQLRILCGGEALPLPLAEQLRPLGETLWNLYGPTESTIWSAVEEIPPHPELISLGRPIANTDIYLLGRDFRPVPVGVPGEVFIGGAGLSRGYLDRPGLTAERFLPHPLASQAGARLYRVGDLARFLSDGRLEYLGRTDFQVKVRGYRIELGEIEAALGRLDTVAQCVVTATSPAGPSGESGESRLVAYVVTDEGELDASALREALRESLPDYMVPAVFVALDELPLTPNGKVDRRALPAVEGDRASGAYQAPRTATEEVAAAIWGEVLQVERVGLGESFFDLGGHSLLGTRLISRLRRAFEVDISLRDLFAEPTVEACGARLDALRGQDFIAPPPLTAAERTGPVQLSFAQQRLWFIDQFEPASAAYNIPGTLRLKGDLSLAVVTQAIAGIVERHEALRTTFTTVDRAPVQVISPEAKPSVPVVDLSGMPAESREAVASALVARESETPFDLAEGPLFRGRLLRLSAQEHLLTTTMHHIVSDAWSVGVLAQELTAFYGALVEGREPDLPDLPVQYADFARWQREWLSGEALEAQLSYWRGQLSDAPRSLDLPTDRPRPSAVDFSGGRSGLQLSESLTAALGQLSKFHGVTPFMTLLAAYATLLHRYSGQRDLVIGSPIAGRNREEIEPLIGFFVNAIALRVEISSETTFADLLATSRRVTLEAADHQDLPFERLVEELNPDRDASRQALFQVVLAVQETIRKPRDLGGLEVSLEEVPLDIAKFDLTLSTLEVGGSLRLDLNFSRALFDSSTAERFLGHLERLLEGAVEAPRSNVSQLPLLASAERRQLLEWSQRNPVSTSAEEVSGAGIHHLFEAWAVRTPEAPALSFEDLRISYRELDQRATSLALELQRRGVGAEVPVGLCVERSMEMVVGLLGILKAGGVYVPLDPAYPAERLRFILEDAGIDFLVTEEKLIPLLPETSATILDLASRDLEDAPEPLPKGVLPEIHPQQLAYVIYTSGSTGQPKGVGVTHGNVRRLMAATEPWFDFGPDDVWTLFHSYAFDFSVWELWGALAYGGRLVVVPYWTSRSPEAFAALLAREEVTVLNQTPSAFRQLMGEPAAQALSSLSTVVFGGEALEPAVLEPWLSVYGDEKPRLINMYGITETTVHVTYRPITSADLGEGQRSPVGTAIPDLSLQLGDGHSNWVPVGVPGELLVGGAGLARGYLGRPGLTAERFIPDAWGGEAGARLYRSGDLGRRRSSGEVDYLGRLDQQVKIRGFRIELGEIEAALVGLPSVSSAAVLAREDSPGDQRLVAYLVAAEESPPAASELRELLEERLPSYMVPAAFLWLEELPLTAHGKLDRRALPRPEEAQSDRAEAGEYQAPGTQVEEVLAGLWAELLGLERVGVQEDFFDLGGHSLLATQVVSAIRDLLGVEIPLRLLFEDTTVALLAQRVEKLRGDLESTEQNGPTAPPIVATGEPGPHPLSFTQQRLWLIDELAPGSTVYNVPAIV
ncbi:MAG: amino acid adenylation domain-containing protein, partial [Deltaproteobacteria bacterium]|nr:amino acid adenylation domain-containing protein [Deltaproteobacteria bacterium]